MAVWGWSYGGFAAAMILAQDEEVFHCGISVAPITSWAHYGESWFPTPLLDSDTINVLQSLRVLTPKIFHINTKYCLYILARTFVKQNKCINHMIIHALTQEVTKFIPSKTIINSIIKKAENWKLMVIGGDDK